ncbi:MAG: NADH-quinone oxidoreductase subunit C [Elusimicrobiales bacterium]|nr:NADH-quinone oxidoreductase subunit C [Elusimicrobiales bacterium]
MEKENALKTALETNFASLVSDVKIARPRRLWATTSVANFKEVINWLNKEQGFTHLSTITGVDSGANFEFLYHIANGGLMLTLKVLVPSANPTAATVTDIFPGAEDYERELVDMFGATITGLPPGNRYPLPDGWPEGQYPLRKSWKPADLYPQEENKCQK